MIPARGTVAKMTDFVGVANVVKITGLVVLVNMIKIRIYGCGVCGKNDGFGGCG